jgi:N-hydroxyarylamine O-acetyltransferase
LVVPVLEAYLARIGFTGPLRADLATLSALHRAHLSEISYENLDIHFGREVLLGLEPAYQKIVMANRGGWCFEMNTLFRWALEAVGFKVTLLSATAAFDGDHMLLLVELPEGRYLADMGWGNGFHEPLPLIAGPYRQRFRRFDLSQEGDNSWRFSNLDFGEDGFSFTLSPREISHFEARSQWLQRDPASSFVRVVKGFRFTPDGDLHVLRGAVLSTLTATGKRATQISSASEYETVWRNVFRSPLPNVAELWGKVHEAHVAWAQSKAQ